jgi:predicted  nucleic acid-binding Zn-ribbon protein
LEALQQEQSFTKEQLSEYEDKLLELMMAIDNGSATRDKLSAELVKLKSEQELEMTSLHTEQTDLGHKITELSKDRAEAAANITPASLARYDSIRKTKNGPPVAKVVGGVCQGCRVRLPSGEAQRAKTTGDFVQCSSCRRILYVV